jgi:hypothetical protein
VETEGDREDTTEEYAEEINERGRERESVCVYDRRDDQWLI